MKNSKNAKIESDKKKFEKALEAYFKNASKKGFIPIQPSLSLYEVTRDFVFLRNGTDLLAKYNHRQDKFVEPTKKDLKP